MMFLAITTLLFKFVYMNYLCLLYTSQDGKKQREIEVIILPVLQEGEIVIDKNLQLTGNILTGLP